MMSIVLFSVMYGLSQLLALRVMVTMPGWGKWPSKRFEQAAIAVLVLGVITLSVALGWNLWTEL